MFDRALKLLYAVHAGFVFPATRGTHVSEERARTAVEHYASRELRRLLRYRVWRLGKVTWSLARVGEGRRLLWSEFSAQAPVVAIASVEVRGKRLWAVAYYLTDGEEVSAAKMALFMQGWYHVNEPSVVIVLCQNDPRTTSGNVPWNYSSKPGTLRIRQRRDIDRF